MESRISGFRGGDLLCGFVRAVLSICSCARATRECAGCVLFARARVERVRGRDGEASEDVVGR